MRWPARESSFTPVDIRQQIEAQSRFMRTLGVERINGHEKRMCSPSEGEPAMAVSAPVLGLIVYPEASSVPGLCRLPPLSRFQETFRQVNTATLA